MTRQQAGMADGRTQIDLMAPRSGPGGRAGADMSMRHQARSAQRIAQHIERHLVPHTEETAPEHRPIAPAIEALRAVTKLATVVESWRCKLARAARRRGAKWSEIGRALGVSRQAAHERYRR